MPLLHAQELLDAEKENQQDIVDQIDEERAKVRATTQITETVRISGDAPQHQDLVIGSVM